MTGRPRLRIGLLGAGGIAGFVGLRLSGPLTPPFDIVAVAGSRRDSVRAAALAKALCAEVVGGGSELGGLELDVVLEAAGVEGATACVPELLEAGIDVVLMSVGALADPEVDAARERFRDRAALVLPSGGICGLDGVQALSAAGILRTARLTTVKHPRGLRSAPYLEGNDLPVVEPATVFEGTAREAIRGFPSNANVAVALSIAGVGLDATLVRIVADPSATRTTHRVEASGDGVSIDVQVATSTLSDSPRTSVLAACSALEALRTAMARRYQRPSTGVEPA